jgi:hypothetical protein
MVFLLRPLERGEDAAEIVHIGLRPHDADQMAILGSATLIVKRGLVDWGAPGPGYALLSSDGPDEV